jgi:putative transposase
VARKLRVEYEGAIYHVMNRGDGGEKIFRDDFDRAGFVRALGEVCARTAWQVHAYCLMPNHFHVVLETPQANLVAGMKWWLGTYTNRYNRRHRRPGHVFAGRYKALVVDGSGDGYLRTVAEYVHLNPVRAGLLQTQDPLRSYPWSSYPAYLERPARRPAWLRVDRVLGDMGIPKDSAAGRRVYERLMEARRGQDHPDYARIRRGWCWGDRKFRKELLAQMRERMGSDHYGEERSEGAEAWAEEVLAEELKRLGLNEATLTPLAKGDPSKVRIAMRLRETTTVGWTWIAKRLRMGTRQHATQRVYEHRKAAGGERAEA